MIEVEDLHKAYGGHAVLRGVSFRCRPGRVTGFLGPNGAGKSTTLRVLCGLANADRGRALIGGVRYAEHPNVGSRVGVMLDTSALHPGRTGRESARLVAMMTGRSRSRADAVLDPAVQTAEDVPPVDVVLECSGVQPAVDLAVAATAPAATVVLVGTGAQVTLPLDVVQSRELVLKGVFRYAHVYPAAIELAAAGRVRLDEMVTSHHPLEDAVGALLAARRDPMALKAVVHPSSS